VSTPPSRPRERVGVRVSLADTSSTERRVRRGDRLYGGPVSGGGRTGSSFRCSKVPNSERPVTRRDAARPSAAPQGSAPASVPMSRLPHTRLLCPGHPTEPPPSRTAPSAPPNCSSAGADRARDRSGHRTALSGDTYHSRTERACPDPTDGRRLATDDWGPTIGDRRSAIGDWRRRRRPAPFPQAHFPQAGG
jgi:hypothetical protein